MCEDKKDESPCRSVRNTKENYEKYKSTREPDVL